MDLLATVVGFLEVSVMASDLVVEMASEASIVSGCAVGVDVDAPAPAPAEEEGVCGCGAGV